MGLPVQEPLLALSAWPWTVVPLIAGSVVFEGADVPPPVPPLLPLTYAESGQYELVQTPPVDHVDGNEARVA